MIASKEFSSIQEFHKNYFAPLRLRGCSDSTKRQYIIQLRHFERFLGRKPILSDFDDDIVNAFLGSIVERGNSPATANKARNHILSLWRFAARKRIVDQFPDVPPVREPKRIPLAWLKEDLVKLFDSCRQESGRISGVNAGLWWSSLHYAYWDTAERKTALLEARWEDLDLGTRWLRVRAETRKGKKSDRMYRLHEDTIDCIKQIQLPKRDLIWPWPYSNNYIYKRYNIILDRAGLPTDRKSKFHRMRKSSASHFEAAGGNATELLDHSNRRVTKDSYLDPRIITVTHASEVLFRPQVATSKSVLG